MSLSEAKIVDSHASPLVPCTFDAMTSFQAPRGTTDILPDDQRDRLAVQRVCADLAETFGYAPVLTPTFEDSDLFLRTTGESTDIVQKETYTFEDRGGHSLTLRPEGTPGVCRAYLERGLHNTPQPARLYYVMPMYRFERPQAGRFREFWQFGVEALGDSDPAIDAEVIELAWRVLGIVRHHRRDAPRQQHRRRAVETGVPGRPARLLRPARGRPFPPTTSGG